MIYVDDLQLRAGDLITMANDRTLASRIADPFWPLLILSFKLLEGRGHRRGLPKTYQIKLLDQWGGIAHRYIDHEELHECVTLISRNE
mgnify:FL=1